MHLLHYEGFGKLSNLLTSSSLTDFKSLYGDLKSLRSETTFGGRYWCQRTSCIDPWNVRHLVQVGRLGHLDGNDGVLFAIPRTGNLWPVDRGSNQVRYSKVFYIKGPKIRDTISPLTSSPHHGVTVVTCRDSGLSTSLCRSSVAQRTVSLTSIEVIRNLSTYCFTGN